MSKNKINPHAWADGLRTTANADEPTWRDGKLWPNPFYKENPKNPHIVLDLNEAVPPATSASREKAIKAFMRKPKKVK